MFGFGGGLLGAAGGASTSMLNGSLQSSLQGGGFTAPSSGFGGILSGLAGGVTNNALQGAVPGQGSGELTTQQVAAQMQIGGPMSALSLVGNSFLPKLVFPIAGLFSLVDGIKAFTAMKRDVEYNNTGRNFDPFEFERNLGYNQAVSRHDSYLTSTSYKY